MNKIFLVTMKYLDPYFDKFIYVVSAQNYEECVQILDKWTGFSIPSDHDFEIVKDTKKESKILLEYCQCQCRHIDIYEIDKKLKKHEDFFEYHLYDHDDYIIELKNIIKKCY